MLDAGLADLEARRKRTSEQIGKVDQKRGVLRNLPVIAGTRIPTSAVWSFHEDGRSEDEIIREYPSLTHEDVRAAIEYEQGKKKAS